MKPEEAIGMYKRFKYYLERERKTDSDHYKSNLIVLEALEKQVAKKPIALEGLKKTIHICCECEEEVEKRWKGCPYCLTPMDWSEE